MPGSRDHVENANVENILCWDQRLDALDYFELLAVSRDATEQELHTAYLRFALTFHPDTHPHATAPVRAALTRIFQRGVEAHQVLSNSDTARTYQQMRARGHRRFGEFRQLATYNLSQDLPTLHEQCRSAGAKIEALQAARAFSKGDLPQVEQRLLSALRFDGDSNADVERCLVALAAHATPTH